MVARSAETVTWSGTSARCSTVLAGAGVAALVAAAVLSPDGIEDGPVLCPFRLATGLPCPGCGLTRSWVYLAHGQWADAFAANPFGYLTFAAVLGLVAAVAVGSFRRQSAPLLTPIAASRPFIAVAVGCWLIFAIVRAVVVIT